MASWKILFQPSSPSSTTTTSCSCSSSSSTSGELIRLVEEHLPKGTNSMSFVCLSSSSSSSTTTTTTTMKNVTLRSFTRKWTRSFLLRLKQHEEKDLIEELIRQHQEKGTEEEEKGILSSPGVWVLVVPSSGHHNVGLLVVIEEEEEEEEEEEGQGRDVTELNAKLQHIGTSLSCLHFRLLDEKKPLSSPSSSSSSSSSACVEIELSKEEQARFVLGTGQFNRLYNEGSSRVLPRGRNSTLTRVILSSFLEMENYPITSFSPPSSSPSTSDLVTQGALLSQILLDKLFQPHPLPRSLKVLDELKSFNLSKGFSEEYWRPRIHDSIAACKAIRWKLLDLLVLNYSQRMILRGREISSSFSSPNSPHFGSSSASPISNESGNLLLLYKGKFVECTTHIDVETGELLIHHNAKRRPSVKKFSINNCKIEKVNDCKTMTWEGPQDTESEVEVEVEALSTFNLFKITICSFSSSYSRRRSYEECQIFQQQLSSSGLSTIPTLVTPSSWNLRWFKLRNDKQEAIKKVLQEAWNTAMTSGTKTKRNTTARKVREALVSFLQPDPCSSSQVEYSLVVSSLTEYVVLKAPIDVRDTWFRILWNAQACSLQESTFEKKIESVVSLFTKNTQSLSFQRQEFQRRVRSFVSNIEEGYYLYSGFLRDLGLAGSMASSWYVKLQKDISDGVPLAERVCHYLNLLCSTTIDVMCSQVPFVLILGRTGAGKSSLINAIFEKSMFETGSGLESTTGTAQEGSGTLENFILVDTRGWGEGKGRKAIQCDVAATSEESLLTAIRRYKPAVLLYVIHPLLARTANEDNLLVQKAYTEACRVATHQISIFAVLSHKRSNGPKSILQPDEVERLTQQRERDLRAQLSTMTCPIRQILSVESLPKSEGGILYEEATQQDVKKLIDSITQSLQQDSQKGLRVQYYYSSLNSISNRIIQAVESAEDPFAIPYSSVQKFIVSTTSISHLRGFPPPYNILPMATLLEKSRDLQATDRETITAHISRLKARLEYLQLPVPTELEDDNIHAWQLKDLFTALTKIVFPKESDSGPKVRTRIFNWLNNDRNRFYLYKNTRIDLWGFVNALEFDSWESYLQNLKDGKTKGDNLLLLAAAEVFSLRFFLVSSLRTNKDAFVTEIAPEQSPNRVLPQHVIGAAGFNPQPCYSVVHSFELR